MDKIQSDTLVFFGATGDLAYKKIFPALQAMIKRGHLNVPIIGVAKAGWNLDQMKARAKDSLEKHGGLGLAAFEKLCNQLRYEHSLHGRAHRRAGGGVGSGANLSRSEVQSGREAYAPTG